MTDVNADPDRRHATSGGGVKSVETSLRIVEALRGKGGAKVSELVDVTDLSKGAVYKHLTTLMRHDFVVKKDNEYHLGFRFLDYGGWLRSHYVGSALIKPQVRELADETNEVALFGIRENNHKVTLFRENGNRGVFTRTRLGRRLYLHQTAGGKAILSQLPASEVTHLCETVGLPRATENTITDEAELLEELERVRERGYALNKEESTDGLVSISVPLVPDGRVIGACGIAGPLHRMDDERLTEEMAPMLLSAVNELELNITHSQKSVSTFGSGGGGRQ